MSETLGKATLTLEANLGPYAASMGLADKTALNLQRTLQGVTAASGASTTATNRLGAASLTSSRSHAQNSKELGNMERSARGGIGAFTGLGRAMFFASNAFLGGVLIGGALKQIVDKTRELDLAMGQLKTALGDSGASWSTYGGQVSSTLKTQEDLSLFTKADLANSLDKLVLSTGNVTKAERELGIAANLARLPNENLALATTQVAQAGLGHAVVLRGLQIALPKITVAHDALKRKLEELKAAHEHYTTAQLASLQAQAKASDMAQTGAASLDLLAKKTAGADKAAIAGSDGMLKFHDVLTKIEISAGQVLVPEITKVIESLTEWMDHLNKTGKAQKDLREGIGLLKDGFHAVGAVVGTVSKVFKVFADNVGGAQHAIMLIGGVFVGYKMTTGLLAVITRVNDLRLALLAAGDAQVLGVLGGIAAALVVIKAMQELKTTKDKQAFIDKTGAQQIFGGSFEGHKAGGASFTAKQGVFKGQQVTVQNINGQTWVVPVGSTTTQTQTQTRTHSTGPGSGAASAQGGGFIPQGQSYVEKRSDQGRDLQTNPGGNIIAPGDGAVIAILHNPGSGGGFFGNDYPVVEFSTGPYKGMGPLYLGHVIPDRGVGGFQKGDILGHTASAAEAQKNINGGAAPGWAEIGFAPGGSPGPVGQRTPFGKDSGKSAPPSLPKGTPNPPKKPKVPPIISGAALLAAFGAPRTPVYTVGSPQGLLTPGNIDIANRPVAHNKDGSISTVRSISISVDGKEVLIPTVINGKVVSNQAAIDHYMKTKQNLGSFSSVAAANKYAVGLHDQQAKMYSGGVTGNLRTALAEATSSAQSSTGNTALKWLKVEQNDLKVAKVDLTAKLASTTGKQHAAVALEITNIDGQLKEVGKKIKTNLHDQAVAVQKAQAAKIAAIKASFAQEIADDKTNITSALSTLSQELDKALQAKLQSYIDTVLGPKFFQGTDAQGVGLKTPAELLLAQMQAVDSVSSLQDALVAAQKQLVTDQGGSGGLVYDASTGITTTKLDAAQADKLEADQKAVVQAQRMIDENNLSIKATAERAQADKDYADAVKVATADEAVVQQKMDDALRLFGQGLLDNTATLSDLPGIVKAAGDGLDTSFGNLTSALSDPAALDALVTATGTSAAFLGKTAADLLAQLSDPTTLLGTDFGNLHDASKALSDVMWLMWLQLSAAGDPNAGAAPPAGAGDTTGAAGELQRLHELAVSGDITPATYAYLISGHKLQIPGLDTGGEVLKTGLAVVHAGETYSGVGKGLGSASGQPVIINFNGWTGNEAEAAMQVGKALERLNFRGIKFALA